MRNCYCTSSAILFAIGAAALAATPAAAQSTAETTDFQAGSDQRPVSATTTFFAPLWTSIDAMNTAQHELLHAIGFSRFYALFRPHEDASRNYKAADGRVLAKLTPSTTHIDPAAGTVDGFAQAQSVMRPDATVGPRMRAQDRNVEDRAYGWTGRNLKIVIVFDSAFPTREKETIEDAAAAAKGLFGSNETGPKFTWTVKRSASVVGEIEKARTTTIKDLVDPDSAIQATAVVRTLALGPAMLPELRAQGAKAMFGLNPSKQDVVYSLLSGERDGLFKTNRFGVHVAPRTSRATLAAIGRTAGFFVPKNASITPERSPSVYVQVGDGRDLWEVMAATISRPEIKTVNLAYYEH